MNPNRLIRLKRTWLVVAVILYTVIGFFVAPRIIRDQALSRIELNLGRQARIESVSLNPYTLALTVEDFELRDPDETVFVAFDRLYANFEPKSLFRWAWTIGEIHLERPRVNVRVMPDRSLNFEDMIGTVERRVEEDPQLQEEWTKVPRLILERLRIEGALITATNLAAVEPESLSVRPADLDLRDFSTLPNERGDYEISAIGHGGGRWVWTGELQFDPLHASGTFTLARSQLPGFWRVIRNRVDFEVPEGELALRLDYAVDFVGDELEASITDADIKVDRIRVREKGVEPDLLAVDSLRVHDLELHYPEQALEVGRVAVHGPELIGWLTPEGTLNWERLAPKLPASTDSVPKPAPEPWDIDIDEILLVGGSVHAEDRTIEPPFAVDLNSINVTLRDVSASPGERFQVESDLVIAGEGRLRVRGQAGAQPPSANLAIELQGLPLGMFQTYVDPLADLRIESGTVGLDGSLHFAEGPTPEEPEIGFIGSFSSDDLLLRDTLKGDPFLGWERLRAVGIDFEPSRVIVDEVIAVRPQGKIHIAEDRTTNIQTIFARALADTTGPAEPAAAPPAVQVSRVSVEDGWLDFTDVSLILPFAAGIDSLSGEITGLSSRPESRALVDLRGEVHPNGQAKVTGELNPLAEEIFLDLQVVFRDFDLPVLTPYSGQYIGKEIDKGKLELDLEYRLENRHLVGDNHIRLQQLEYGDDVESPDATSLPVGLATALLKDSRGNIDLEVSIEGDVDDPGFSAGDAIFDVLRNTIVKVAASPFKLLGGLVDWGGDDPEELAFVGYSAGDTLLSVAEREKLVSLAAALNERPELKLEVRGVVDPVADGAAIREAGYVLVEAEFVARDPERYAQKDDEAHPSRLLREMFDERYGEDAAERLEDVFQVPQLDDEGNPRGDRTELDEAAFYGHLRKTMVDDIPVPDTRLQRLGMDRSARVKDVLAGEGGIEETRIFLLGVETLETTESGPIRTELTVTD